jgi:hypothetical protein
MNVTITAEASGSCATAQDAVDDANRQLAEAEWQWDQADKALGDDLHGHAEADNAANFAACLLTSGVLGVFSGNPVLPVIGGVGCLAYAGYQEWRLYQKTQEDLEARDAARAKQIEADKALRKAQSARDKACNYAGGCGSRGGRGFRRPDGRCAGWHDWGYA